MEKYFNITGSCNPAMHYMVNLDSRLSEIRKMIDKGEYFTINRGRQHGKTTILKALKKYLSDDYIVVDMDFQFMSHSNFENEEMFTRAFARELWRKKDLRSFMNNDVQEQVKELKKIGGVFAMGDLFGVLSEWCDEAEKPVVLMIDEVDSASNNQVFIDFLAQLRGYYLDRDETSAFQSVILAGVHDIRNIRQKIRPDAEHRHNSPWNIASEFNVDMSFNVQDISGMLSDYENDHKTGMNIQKISQLVYGYTSGYPVLVSTLCKYMDEYFDWSKEGFLKSINRIYRERLPLFESLINKLEDNSELNNMLHSILFDGRRYVFNSYDSTIATAVMYGFVKNNEDNGVVISNRIFETVVYDWFISVEKTTSSIYSEGEADKNQFIQNGRLDMKKILEKFVVHFNDIYGDKPDKFKEDDGRKLFLLYLRPIINGTGNYYIEAQTRNQRRTDVIVDYLGNQYIIELKIWHGDEYNSRGEQQLTDYLDYYHINKGYLLSFNFNKNKQVGLQTIDIGDKTIVEAIV